MHISLLSFLSSLFGCQLFYDKSKRVQEKNISYLTKDQYELKAQLFEVESNDIKPLVIVIHGGGWRNRGGDMESLCRTLAKNGFKALNITYRFAPEHIHPTQVNDVVAVQSWILSHAQEFKIDTQKISIWGYSAGAHLAFMMAHSPELKLKINSVVVGGIPSDLTAYPKSQMIKDYMGSQLADAQAQWKDASPIYQVNSNSPPTFLYHGEWDMIVGYEQTEALFKKLQSVGVEAELNPVKNMGHIATYFLSDDSVKKGIQFIQNSFTFAINKSQKVSN